MDSDLVSLLIYVALAIVGVIASAIKNKAKKQQQSMSAPRRPQVPRTFQAEPQREVEHDLGPLMDLFDIPKPKQEKPDYETIEYGPGVEDVPVNVESETASAELAGFETDTTESSLDKSVSELETFEEGQSDIQKMIARYEALRQKQEGEFMDDDISKGEIVSVEAEEAAKMKQRESTEFFDAKKAIIYSEILRRREF